MSRATLAKAPGEVAAMFDEVAQRYDLMNDLLSFGQDRRWRRDVVRAVAAGPGDRVLDLAAGTGTSAAALAAAGGSVVAVDFSLGMLRVARSRHPRLPVVAADALALPFDDACFDAVTISFGLRNLVDVEEGLRELYRVTRPGGRLVVCELSHPLWWPFRAVYDRYLARALPSLARLASSSPDAYGYLAESIRAWPDQRTLASRLAEAGWDAVRWTSRSGGIVAIHLARRGAHATSPTSSSS